MGIFDQIKDALTTDRRARGAGQAGGREGR